MKHHPHLYAVILAGGSGTRFWPLSRHLYPKQLLKITGNETLIQQTMRRVLGSVSPDRVFISTNPAQADSIRIQLGQWKDQIADNFVVEPEGRNTAPALALVATVLQQRDPEAVMLALPADHVIKRETRFHAAVSLGASLADAGHLVTFGVKPIRAETGYGYIKPDMRTRLGARKGMAGHPVGRFVEKPDAATALKYLKAGNYYWNSGIFMWRADVFLQEVARYQPALAKGVKTIGAMLSGSSAGTDWGPLYKKLPSVSVDYGVMEHSSRAAMVPADFVWSDVGNWSSLEEVVSRNASRNVVSGNVVDIDSSDSILYADRRVVATIGLSNMVVVDTPDATLVCPKDRAQDVKKVVDVLKKQGAPEHLEHRTMFRPWGSYTVLEEGPGYKVKRIAVNPGGRLSLQLHHQRSEHWVVISGVARVTCGDKIIELSRGHSTDIPVETPHRLENPGQDILHIIEVQNGPYLGEDDIVRLKDDYGRIHR